LGNFSKDLGGKSVANGATDTLLTFGPPNGGKLKTVYVYLPLYVRLYINIDDRPVQILDGAIDGSLDLNLSFEKLEIMLYNNTGATITTKNITVSGEAD